MNAVVRITSSQRRTQYFTAAGILPVQTLGLPSSFVQYLDGIVDKLEVGCITLFESNAVKALHSHLHQLMVDAVHANWQIKFVDIANCFNPQLIGTLCFDRPISSQDVLQKISLARPFQIFQSVSILQQLKREVARDPKQQFLILVTDISAQFFNPQLENEDSDFPIPQLELLRHVLGILQGLASQGHCVILTDRTEYSSIHKIISAEGNSTSPRVQGSALAYASNIHIHIKETQTTKFIKRKLILENHPFRQTPETRYISSFRHKRQDERQATLANWFN